MKFSDQLKSLGYAGYADYLRSAHWMAFRAQYKAAGQRLACRVCGGRRVQLHHQTYVRLGREELTDVVPLCREHHEAVHIWLRESGRRFVEYTHEALVALGGKPAAAAAEQPREPKAKVKKRKAKKQAAFGPYLAELRRLFAIGCVSSSKVYRLSQSLDVDHARRVIAAGKAREAKRVANPLPQPKPTPVLAPKRLVKVEPMPVNARATPGSTSSWAAFRARLSRPPA